MVHVGALFLAFLALLLSGCAEMESYADDLTAKNNAAHEEAMIDMNLETVRAYNTKSKKFEYVERDTVQKWNEEEKRWEISPPGEKEQSDFLFEPDPE